MARLGTRAIQPFGNMFDVTGYALARPGMDRLHPADFYTVKAVIDNQELDRRQSIGSI